MPSTIASRDDVARLVAEALQSEEFAKRAEDVGLDEEKIVESIWTEIAQIWETASSSSIELQNMQVAYDRKIDKRFTEHIQRQRLLLRNAEVIVLTTWPLLLSLYFGLRYSEKVRS